MPIISVIVPVYNVEIYLKRCLDSILSQTFVDFEVICVNDGSTDHSYEILKEYVEKDKRVIVLDQNNQGLSMARNNGVAKASGDYVYFVDSDDYVHCRLLEIAYENIVREKADICAVGFAERKLGNESINEDVDGSEIRVYDNFAEEFLNCKTGIPMTAWSKLYKRDLLKEVQFEAGMYYEDIPFVAMIVNKARRLVLVRAKLYYYFQRGNSIMKSCFNEKKAKDFLKIFDLIGNFYVETPACFELCRRRLFPRLIKQLLNMLTLSGAEEKVWSVVQEGLKNLNKKGFVDGSYMKWNRRFPFWLLINFKGTKCAKLILKMIVRKNSL